MELSKKPKTFPCRDSETQRIKEYITNGIRNKGSSSSLYISGMPGTGKTATTTRVISDIKKDKNLSQKFRYFTINCMSLIKPNHVYSIIYKKITGVWRDPANAALFLDEFFKRKNGKEDLLRATIGGKMDKEKE